MEIATKKSMRRTRVGFTGIAVWQPKHEVNVGGLWRSGFLYNANFLATVGRRYSYQPSDTPKTTQRIPLFHFEDMDDLLAHTPHGCPVVGIELSDRAVPLSKFQFPPSCLLLCGAEDHGLPPKILDRCHHVVQIESAQPWSMNVSVAGSIAMRERYLQGL